MARKFNCIKNGKQYFRKTIVIGHKLDGTPVRKEFYGTCEKDADNQINEYLQKLKSGLKVDKENMTIEEGMHHWLFDVLLYSKNNKSASFDKHECNYRNYIKDRKIGYIKIQNATSAPFEDYYIDLYNNGIDIVDSKTQKKKHKNVSEDKIFDLNKTLRTFFSYCIKQKYTLDNPCSLENIELPGNADGDEDETDVEGNNIQAFDYNEINTIKENLKYSPCSNNTFNMAIQLDLVTGLRLGELLGLKKKFVTKYMIKVRNTLKRVKVFDSSTEWHRETKLIKPKSRTSIREVNFPTPLWKSLELYFKEQEEKWRKNGLQFNDDSLIFTTDKCKPIDIKNFSRAWERFLKRINIDYKKPHAIRDTYATTLVRRGANIHDVKNLLGHSSIKITEKYYIYVFPEDKSNTVKLLDDIVS